MANLRAWKGHASQDNPYLLRRVLPCGVATKIKTLWWVERKQGIVRVERGATKLRKRAIGSAPLNLKKPKTLNPKP